MRNLKLTSLVIFIIVLSCGEKKDISQSQIATKEQLKQLETIQTLESITENAVNVKSSIEESINILDELLNEF